MARVLVAVAFALVACNSDAPPVVPAAQVAESVPSPAAGSDAAVAEPVETKPAESPAPGSGAAVARPADAKPAAPDKAATKPGPSAERALAIARECAAAAPFDGVGVGGNPLVYDAMTWSQPPAASRASDYVFYVYVPEEPPRTQVPNGLALAVDTLRERCTRAAMD